MFDVSLSVPEPSKVVLVGQDLRMFISLLQIGEIGEVDITVTYVIKDFESNVLFREGRILTIFEGNVIHEDYDEGSTLFEEEETFVVLGEEGFVKSLSTAGLSPGDYVIGIEVVYPEGFVSSSARFTVSGSGDLFGLGGGGRVLVILIVFIVVAILLAFVWYRKPKLLINVSSTY